VLIWQESSFRPYEISPAGAQGIAQFMPNTADERDLAKVKATNQHFGA
jgi:soluble lytic murein transglycosylase-like protein